MNKRTIEGYISRMFLFLVPFILVFNIVFGIYIYYHSGHENAKSMYAAETAIYIGFESLNGVIRSAEKIIRENSVFFERYDNEEMVRIIQMTKELMVYNTYIDDVVFYKINNDKMITTKGTISKHEFFNYAYHTNETGVEFWDGIMTKYNTPTVIPISDYVNPLGNVKRLFVVPKIFTLFDVGVLVFVSEQRFLEFTGISYENVGAEIHLYNDSGYLILGNSNNENYSVIPAADLHTKPIITKHSILGVYSCEKWFDYENIILTYKARSPMMAAYYIYTFIFLAAWLIIYRISIKNANTVRGIVSVNKDLKYPLLLSVATNSAFYANNKELLENVLSSDKKAQYILAAVIFKDNSEAIGRLFEDMGKSAQIIYSESGISCYLLELYEDTRKNKISAFEGLVANNEGVSIELSREFNKIHELDRVFSRLMLDIGKRPLSGGDIPGKRHCKLPSNLPSKLAKLISSQNHSDIRAYFEKIIRDNIEWGISFDKGVYLLMYLYHELARLSGATEKGEAFEQIDLMLCDGIKKNARSYDFERISNVFYNTVNEILDITKVKGSKLDKKEIISYLDNNYMKYIYMEEVADKYNMSAKYFSYYFKRELGIGFNDYLAQLRIEEAKNLLLNSDLSVAEVSDKIGYSNAATFIVAFKKYCHITPGQFRKNNSQNS